MQTDEKGVRVEIMSFQTNLQDVEGSSHVSIR